MADFKRLPSVPFIDLDLLLGGEGAGGVGQTSSDMEGLDEEKTLKAMDAAQMHTITTGIPGKLLLGNSAEALEGESSPRSLLNPLSSLDSTEMSNPRVKPGSLLHMSPPTHDSGRLGGQQKQKRKVGRPIAYCGDPNSPDLTPAERRRILRRIANRESARRVRSRRQDLLEDMAAKAREMEGKNRRLSESLRTMEAQQHAVEKEMCELDSSLRRKSLENEQLQAEVARLQSTVAKSGSSPAASKDTVSSAAFMGDALAWSTEMNTCAASTLNAKQEQSVLPYSSPLPYGAQTVTLPQSYMLPGSGEAGAMQLDEPGLAAVAQLYEPLLQMEPIERSFSEFLRHEFPRCG